METWFISYKYFRENGAIGEGDWFYDAPSALKPEDIAKQFKVMVGALKKVSADSIILLAFNKV
ncbi:hypothetical protein ACJP8O_000677 [Enterobacter hormaechei]|uniref:hypothetical protein n=1 Tax=Enterobacter cloacae complex TaxID=354276 RepID=UPI00217644C0|nr:hypothetical protein [Enterobacter hormaechei]UWB11101.1 hypothetical protein M5T15_05840 [Enterobacter hormaechei]